MRLRRIRALTIMLALGLVAAACGGGYGDSPAASDSTTTISPASTTTTPPTTAPTSLPATPVGLTFTVADGYSVREIGAGIKPDLELAPDGTPGITYLVEDLQGHIGYTTAADGWSSQRVVDGYFYGPIGLAYDPTGTPYIAFHDHQDPTFKDDKGDLTVTVLDGSKWVVTSVNDDGHDGWDSTVAIGSDGVVRAAGIDPVQFGSAVGVEYYELTPSGWEITEIGSGPIPYEFNVSLAVDPDGDPALTFYDAEGGDLKYAHRQNGAWSIETVDADGDAGKYSSLTFDATGRPHISYLHLDGPSEGTVRYATLDGETWTTSDVDVLTDVFTGFTGARRVTAVAVDSADRPHVVYSDESVVKRATHNGSGWDIEELVTAGARSLGQLVSFRLGSDDALHLTVFEVTESSPLAGVVAYIRGD